MTNIDIFILYEQNGLQQKDLHNSLNLETLTTSTEHIPFCSSYHDFTHIHFHKTPSQHLVPRLFVKASTATTRLLGTRSTVRLSWFQYISQAGSSQSMQSKEMR